MTAYFRSLKDKTYRRFENVQMMKLGCEDNNGERTKVIYVTMRNETVTLNQQEYQLEMVHT